MSENGREVRYISLVDSLTEYWLKLPLAVMRDVGPAVQTLGGLLHVTPKETFVEAAKIASKARLPIGTCRKHLVTLDRRGWIKNRGRQVMRSGWLRRTATIAITQQTREHIEPYGVLPWWGRCQLNGRTGRLSWSAQAVLSLVMARLMSLKGAIDQQDGCGVDADDLLGSIENMGGEARWQMSIGWIAQQTGLTRDSIASAKRTLAAAGLVRLWAGPDYGSGYDGADIIEPNWDARIVVTPADPGMVRLHIESAAED